MIVSYVTVEIDELEWHERSGLALLVLILSRIIWGFVGSRTARFASFVRGPKTIWRYFQQLIARDSNAASFDHSSGHNPAGGAFVLVLLGLVLAQISLGLFSNDEIYFEGPLAPLVSRDWSDKLSDLHHLCFEILLVAIAVHIIANLAYWLILKKNLIAPMISGSTPVDPGTEPNSNFWAPTTRAVVIVGCVAVLVWVTIGYR